MRCPRPSLAASAILLSLPLINARVANPVDPLQRKDSLDDGASNPRLLQNVREYLLGKRQQVCVRDLYYSVLRTETSATQFCSSYISVPPTSVTTYTTPVTYANTIIPPVVPKIERVNKTLVLLPSSTLPTSSPKLLMLE